MRKAGKIALGCLGIPVVLVLFMIMLALGFKAAGVPAPKIVTKELGQPLASGAGAAGSSAAPASAGAAGASASAGEPAHAGAPAASSGGGVPATVLETRAASPTPAGEPGASLLLSAAKPVRVLLEMEEGMFEILPGPPEQGIQVKADYDESTYELTQEYDVDKDGTPVYHLRFCSKIAFLRRLMKNGHFSDEDMAANRIRVQLPRDTPMELVMALDRSQTEIDLSGVALRQAVCKLRMGEYRLDVNEPNPVAMETFLVDSSMGQVRMGGLSRLRAHRLITQGMMGEMRMDLGGALRNETLLEARMRMGQLRMNLPENAHWDFAHGGVRASMGNVTGTTQNPGTPDPEGPKLHIDAGVLMGELQLGSYPADAASELLGGPRGH
jgi:hypothetical protein